MTERFNQYINSIVFKYVNNQCPNYLNEVFQTAPENNIQTKGSSRREKFFKIKMYLPPNQRRPNGAVLHWSNRMEQNP